MRLSHHTHREESPMGRGMANRHSGRWIPISATDQSSFDRNLRCRRFTHSDPSNSRGSSLCSGVPSALVVLAPTKRRDTYDSQST